MQKKYTVQELAKLAGVSVRTLHHYDSLTLLSPQKRSEAGYRLYGEKELLRLQQILFYRELDVPLKKIRLILDDPKFNLIQALENHRSALQEKSNRLQGLVQTIDKTLSRIKGDYEMVTDKELYCEFSKETLAEHKDYMAKKFNPAIIKEAEENVKKMTKEKWAENNIEGHEIAKEMVKLVTFSPDANEVQNLVARHHKWVENFYQANAQTYKGLSQLYQENLDFRKYYENFHPELTDFLAQAMIVFANKNLS